MTRGEMRRVVEAWRCAPVGLDGHRWPCPRADDIRAQCTDEGCVVTRAERGLGEVSVNG